MRNGGAEVPEPPRRGRRLGRLAAWTGTLALAGLAIAIGSALLPACGLDVGGFSFLRWLHACPEPAAAGSADLDREAERAGALRGRIASLERRLAGLPACPPPAQAAATPPAAPPAPAPVPRPSPEPEPSEFDRRLAAQGGEVSEELTVTLIWNDAADLDLQLECPGGGTAGVAGEGCGGGVLDVDANGYSTGGLRMMDNPVENVRFGSLAPYGTYGIRIFIADSYLRHSSYERARNDGPHPFRVRVLSNGREQVFDGVHPGVGRGDVRFRFTHDEG